MSILVCGQISLQNYGFVYYIQKHFQIVGRCSDGSTKNYRKCNVHVREVIYMQKNYTTNPISAFVVNIAVCSNLTAHI